MVWSIYKDTSSNNVDEWQPNYSAWYYDYDVDTNFSPNRVRFLHDGEHEVWYEFNHKPYSTIVNVVNGMFDIHAEYNILNLIKESGYWGVYIEMFYKKNGKLYVGMGS
jgi:hypothetical protein